RESKPCHGPGHSLPERSDSRPRKRNLGSPTRTRAGHGRLLVSEPRLLLRQWLSQYVIPTLERSESERDLTTDGTTNAANGNMSPQAAPFSTFPEIIPGDAQFQYMDIGTSISTKLYPQANELMLDVKADISNVAGASGESQSSRPIVRQMVIAGSMRLIPGEPLVIGSVDDPSSTHTFQLEVTATKI